MGLYGPVVLTQRIGTTTIGVMGKPVTVHALGSGEELTPLDPVTHAPIALVSGETGHVPQFYLPNTTKPVMLRWGRGGHEAVPALDRSDAGASILSLAGTVPTADDLAEVAADGTAYIAEDTKHLWAWSEGSADWVDMGSVEATVTDDTVADAITGPASSAAVAAQVRDLVVDSVRRHGAVGDGVTDDSAAFVAALAANPRQTVHVPAGEYLIASAERLELTSFMALTGDPNGRTTLRFTHPDGGISLTDNLGPGSKYVYGTTLANLNLNGDGSAGKLITGEWVEEVTLDHLELHDWTDAAVELADASLVQMRDCVPGLVPGGGEELPGLRLLGICGYVNITDMNAYACTPVEVAGASVAHLSVHGWFEGVRDVVRQATPGASSLGIVRIRGRLISTLGETTIFRYTGGSTLNAESIDWSDMDVYLTASTAPLIDFRDVDNSLGTVWVRCRNAVVYAPEVAHLVGANEDQTWFLLHVDHKGITGPPPGRWWVEPDEFGDGKVFPEAVRITSAGDPNDPDTGTTAPPASLYHDVGAGEVYVQATGMTVASRTGWVKVLLDRVLSVIKGPTAIQPPEKVDNDFGVDLFAVNRSPAEDTNPGAPALRVNGAGQARAGWDGAGSNGSFLAQGAGALVGLDPLGVVVYTGGALNLRAASATDRVQFVGLLSPSQFATSARPSAASCDGAVIYDTDLHLPIYSNGTAWCRLDGTPL